MMALRNSDLGTTLHEVYMYMEVDGGSDWKSDILLHWMAAHARLKDEFTEDEKYHNLMTWLSSKVP